VTRPYRRLDPPPTHLTTGQVATLLHVSPKTVTRWAKEGRLPCLHTLGGHRRYPETKVLALLEQLTYRPAEEATQ
jgi:excisionase family DNA binding protein